MRRRTQYEIISIAIVCGDFLANGDSPDDPERDIFTLSEELTVVLAIMLLTG